MDFVSRAPSITASPWQKLRSICREAQPSVCHVQPILLARYALSHIAKSNSKPVRSRLASVRGSLASTEQSPSSITRQSYTWGVVQEYETPNVTQAEVIAFLKSEEISTEELEFVDLPTSIDVMRERLDFLSKVGLEKKHINEYPRVLCCSVKRNMIPVINYLEKLGFTSNTLPSLLRKYPMVLHTSVVVDLQPVIEYLEGFGIDRKDIAKVLLKYPDVLGFRLEGTMSTSVAYLVSIGVGIRAIAPMLVEFPQILGMRVGNNIKPKVEFLCSLGLSKEAMAKILEKHPCLLGLGLEDSMKPAIAALVSAGVREEALPAIVTQFPDVLGVNAEQKLTEKCDWLTKQLKVEPEEVGKIVEKLPQVIVINELMAMERVNFLTNTGGFKENEIAEMVARCPQILALSIEDALIPNLSFFNNEMQRPLQDLVDFPAFFTYNLEDRILPRYQQIRQKGIDCSLSWFLNCSNTKFQERLRMDYMKNPLSGRSKLPGVSEEPPQSRYYSLQDKQGETKAIVEVQDSLSNFQGDGVRDSVSTDEGVTESEEWSVSDEAGEEWD